MGVKEIPLGPMVPMTMCHPHKRELCAELEKVGLVGFLERDDRVGLQHYQAWLEGEQTVHTFEPYVDAVLHLMANICENSPHAVAAAMRQAIGAQSNFCPWCFVLTTHDAHCGQPDCDVLKWLSKAARDQRRIFERVLKGTRVQ